MNFSIVITTYNRPSKVLDLANQLVPIINTKDKIIVVDSSEEENKALINLDSVVYIRSSHKNQPYQRYLGYLTSESEYLVFLDDDMEVVDNQFLAKLEKIFEDKTIAGVAIKFENKQEDSLLAQMPKSKLFKKSGYIKKAKGWLTGYPELKPGKFGLCGNRGLQPLGGGPTEWVSGGAFAARRSAMFQNFNFQLFEIFERKLGMGEDAIIGYGLSKQGKLIFHDELFFLHNDQRDSTYSIDKRAFAKRVAYSRLFLSLEKLRLDNRSLVAGYIHYHYYMIWRIMGSALNMVISPDHYRYKILLGSMEGWVKAARFRFKPATYSRSYWKSESDSDHSSYYSKMLQNVR